MTEASRRVGRVSVTVWSCAELWKYRGERKKKNKNKVGWLSLVDLICHTADVRFHEDKQTLPVRLSFRVSDMSVCLARLACWPRTSACWLSDACHTDWSKCHPPSR